MAECLLFYLISFLGTPYKLGGNVTQDGGIDCGALVLEGLRSVGLWGLSDARAQDIYNHFANKRVYGIPQKANLLFFGADTSKISHVAVVYNDFQMIEAGGDDKTGMVRIRPIKWRSDLVAIIKIF